MAFKNTSSKKQGKSTSSNKDSMFRNPSDQFDSISNKSSESMFKNPPPSSSSITNQSSDEIQ